LRKSLSFSRGLLPSFCLRPLTGKFYVWKTPHQLGVFSNQDKVFEKHDPKIMWPYRLKENGYFCSSGGKVHHGYIPIPNEAHCILYSDQPKFFGVDMKLPPGIETTHFGGHKRGLSTTNPKDDGIFHDPRSANSAIRFLQTYNEDAPFYREVGFYSPHVPFITPARFKELYSVRNITRPSA